MRSVMQRAYLKLYSISDRAQRVVIEGAAVSLVRYVVNAATVGAMVRTKWDSNKSNTIIGAAQGLTTQFRKCVNARRSQRLTLDKHVRQRQYCV